MTMGQIQNKFLMTHSTQKEITELGHDIHMIFREMVGVFVEVTIDNLLIICFTSFMKNIYIKIV